MTENPQRRDAAIEAWNKFARENGVTFSTPPELRGVTATIQSLPPHQGAPLYLPKVGVSDPMSEEDLRESLRRFIAGARLVLGGEPQQFSLVQRVDLANGNKQAHYQQRPFRYPLRGEFGQVEITFAPDRRIVQITSTAVPEVEQLQRAGAGTRPKSDAEQLRKSLVGRSFSYSDPTLGTQTRTVSREDQIAVRELVIYPIVRAADPSVLEFHLAWEIALGTGADQQTIYLDAVTEDLLAIKHSSKAD